MGLGLPDGGHLTHGYYTAKKKITASSIYFQSFPYRVQPGTGLLDFDQLTTNAGLFKPRLIVCGASAYPRDWDYARLRKIADTNGSYLMSDMAHIGGLVAAGEQNSPFEHCDVVTTTTWVFPLSTCFCLLLCGLSDHFNRSAKTATRPSVVLVPVSSSSARTRRPTSSSVSTRPSSRLARVVRTTTCVLGNRDRISFPLVIVTLTSENPPSQTIAGIAVALKQAADPAFKAYAKQVIANARTIAKVLSSHDYKLQTDGTDNHLVLWDLRPLGLTGSKIEKICDEAHITV
jgi:glycine hydroxymethyltransferase